VLFHHSHIFFLLAVLEIELMASRLLKQVLSLLHHASSPFLFALDIFEIESHFMLGPA
jgi:hypothetical protein